MKHHLAIRTNTLTLLAFILAMGVQILVNEPEANFILSLVQLR
jgi:hypothetical protein